jgi:hypothetical protein
LKTGVKRDWDRSTSRFSAENHARRLRALHDVVGARGVFDVGQELLSELEE